MSNLADFNMDTHLPPRSGTLPTFTLVNGLALLVSGGTDDTLSIRAKSWRADSMSATEMLDSAPLLKF